ncbi:MAG: fatty acid desaturase [Proteobacteria bacterium]|nr:fatty acid desaturase [Pseudomonadota bacterium]
MSPAREPAGSDVCCPEARSPDATDADLRQAAAAFAHPITGAGLLQLLTSFGPFVAGCAAMYLAYPISYLLTLALALPTGAMLVRVFIVQHDCGHGSFFASRRANTIVGRLCSIATLTPYANWGRQHGLHHAYWNNLERGAGADIYSACLTMREYLARSPWQRFLYRLPRHPLIAHVLLPPLVFVLLYRLPFDTPRSWIRERNSVHMTNAALVVLFGTLAALLGWRQVLLVHLPIMVVASIVGVWLFTLQHRFEASHWTKGGEWSFVDAALQGSSWFSLPCALHWLTGNIGFHHIHHLNPRVPNYRLRGAHEAVQALRPTRPLGLRGGLRAPWLTLWDEARGRLVRFCDAS